MKKIIFILIVPVIFGFISLKSENSFAAKPTSSCTTIQDGTLIDSKGNLITVGNDIWGYNYQAKMFNGLYDNYSRPEVLATTGDNLMMKWNDAWLSNKDCDEDGKLDRHYGYPSYIGSGAWLTNHISGIYPSSTQYQWNIAGDYVVSFVLGGTYNHDMTITDTGGVLGGSGGYPAGLPYSYWWTINTVEVNGDNIHIVWTYDGAPDAAGAVTDMVGIIADDGSMSGTWHDNYLGGYRVGTWSTSSGAATKVFLSCSWNDFVKIVAVPSSAVKATTDSSIYGEGMWYTDDTKTTEIGPVIWGEFAVIQEVVEDPCGELGWSNYKSELRSGLGNWAD